MSQLVQRKKGCFLHAAELRFMGFSSLQMRSSVSGRGCVSPPLLRAVNRETFESENASSIDLSSLLRTTALDSSGCKLLQFPLFFVAGNSTCKPTCLTVGRPRFASNVRSANGHYTTRPTNSTRPRFHHVFYFVARAKVNVL